MDQGLLPRRYAKALFKLAAERGIDAQVYHLTQALADAFDAQRSLQSALANPFVSKADKVALVNAACGSNAEPATEKQAVKLLDDFVALLDHNHRIAILRDAVLAYRDLYRQKHSIYAVEITSAATLDPKTRARIEEMVKKSIGDGSAEFRFGVNPDLLGGFVVTIENRRLDASLKTELDNIARSLTI